MPFLLIRHPVAIPRIPKFRDSQIDPNSSSHLRRLPVMNVAAPLMAKIKANSTESRTLASLRDTLLPNLLSGELQINQ